MEPIYETEHFAVFELTCAEVEQARTRMTEVLVDFFEELMLAGYEPVSTMPRLHPANTILHPVMWSVICRKKHDHTDSASSALKPAPDTLSSEDEMAVHYVLADFNFERVHKFILQTTPTDDVIRDCYRRWGSDIQHLRDRAKMSLDECIIREGTTRNLAGLEAGFTQFERDAPVLSLKFYADDGALVESSSGVFL